MTDLEWQEGIERALNAVDFYGGDPKAKIFAAELAKALPLRIVLCHTGKDKIGHFRVGPPRDEDK